MSNDFDKRLDLIRQNLDLQGYTIVAKECVGLVEQALRHVFIHNLTQLEEQSRLLVLNAEREIGKGDRGIERFTLGELVGVYRKSKFIEAWGRISGKDLTGIRVINFDELTKLRNTFIHEGREANRLEAEFLFNCLRIILETFALHPAATTEPPETPRTPSSASQSRDTVDIANLLNLHISPMKLDQLIVDLLGKECINELKGKTHADRVAAFLGKVSQSGKMSKLVDVLTKLFPEMFAERGEDVPPESPPEPELGHTPGLTFVNRTAEWERVVAKPEGGYYVFCGPSGYGKTALLHKIQEEFERQRWQCLYISLSEHNQLPKIIQQIGQHVQFSAELAYAEPEKIGERLGEALTRQFENQRYQGFALLVDVDHDPWQSSMDTFKIMVEDVIPGIYDGLWTSEFFRNTPYSYRVVLAGRQIAARMQELNCYSPYSTTTLTPFDADVVWEICRQSIANPAEQQAFASHLLFYSGGHPCCIVNLLERFHSAKIPAERFFHTEQHQTWMKAHIMHEAEKVRASIRNEFRLLFDRLCLYRRIDIVLLQELLQELLEGQQIWRGVAEDAYDLAMKLKDTYLVHWLDDNCRYLHDGIVRRILAIRLREELVPEHFKFLCEKAKNFYVDRLRQSAEDRVYWAIEALFEYVQSHVHHIATTAGRQSLRRKFFAQELSQILALLFDGDDPRSEQAMLTEILKNDWEFHFTLNYYLREDAYTDSPYQELLRRIEAEVAKRKPRPAPPKPPMRCVEIMLERDITAFPETEHNQVLTVIARFLEIDRYVLRCLSVQQCRHDVPELSIAFPVQQRIIECLTAILHLCDTEALRAFIMSAGLDPQLLNQISFNQPLKQLFQFLIPLLAVYGILKDGRHALIAVLESAKNYVGQQGRAQCETLIREIEGCIQQGKPIFTGILATIELPVNDAMRLVDLFATHDDLLARELRPLHIRDIRLAHEERPRSMALVDLTISTTVPLIARFLCEQVANIPQNGIARDYQKIEEAKTALAQYQQAETLDEADLAYVKEQITILCAALCENGIDLTSPDLFSQWGEKHLAVEAFAAIVRRELELVLARAAELPISSRKRKVLEDIADALDFDIERLERAHRKAENSDPAEKNADVARQEAELRKTIQEVRVLIANY